MYEEWIIRWISQNGNIAKEKLEKNMDVNYLEKGFIDSFEFILLLNECEQKFSISFTEDEFSKDDFLTIRGFVRMIEEKSKQMEER